MRKKIEAATAYSYDYKMEIRCMNGKNGYFSLRIKSEHIDEAKDILTKNGISFSYTDGILSMSAAKYLDRVEKLFDAAGLCQRRFFTIHVPSDIPPPTSKEGLSTSNTISIEEHQQRVIPWLAKN